MENNNLIEVELLEPNEEITPLETVTPNIEPQVNSQQSEESSENFKNEDKKSSFVIGFIIVALLTVMIIGFVSSCNDSATKNSSSSTNLRSNSSSAVDYYSDDSDYDNDYSYNSSYDSDYDSDYEYFPDCYGLPKPDSVVSNIYYKGIENNVYEYTFYSDDALMDYGIKLAEFGYLIKKTNRNSNDGILLYTIENSSGTIDAMLTVTYVNYAYHMYVGIM